MSIVAAGVRRGVRMSLRRGTRTWMTVTLCGLGTALCGSGTAIPEAGAASSGSARPLLAPSPPRRPVMLLDFWTTTCGPCRPALTDLQSLHTRYPQLSVLGVAMDGADTAAEVGPLLRQQGVTYPVRVVPAANRRLAQQFGVETYPALFLLDARGHVRWSHSGLLDARTSAALSRQVTGLLFSPEALPRPSP